MTNSFTPTWMIDAIGRQFDRSGLAGLVVNVVPQRLHKSNLDFFYNLVSRCFRDRINDTDRLVVPQLSDFVADLCDELILANHNNCYQISCYYAQQTDTIYGTTNSRKVRNYFLADLCKWAAISHLCSQSMEYARFIREVTDAADTEFNLFGKEQWRTFAAIHSDSLRNHTAILPDNAQFVASSNPETFTNWYLSLHPTQ